MFSKIDLQYGIQEQTVALESSFSQGEIGGKHSLKIQLEQNQL